MSNFCCILSISDFTLVVYVPMFYFPLRIFTLQDTSSHIYITVYVLGRNIFFFIIFFWVSRRCHWSWNIDEAGDLFFISLSWGSFELIGYFFSLMSKCPFHVSLFHSCTFHSSLNTEQKLAIPKVNSKFIVSWEVYKLEFLGKSYIFFQRIIIWSDQPICNHL